MSNRQVPTVYRAVMNDVIENVRADFDEVGVEEAVLQALLRSWETRVAQSRVADFTNDPRMGAIARQFPATTLQEALANSQARVAAAAKPSSSTGAKTDSTATDGAAAAAKNGTANGHDKDETKEGKDDKKEPDQDAKAAPPKDEDEINSDLDDSDDELIVGEDGADEGAEAGGDLVIALYEKVQRVKNKWKITLKDGVIAVGGRDYLFAKCQGEFEF